MIEIRQLKKHYVSGLIKKSITEAVKGVDLSIKKGSVFGLTGESGCGKTTLAMLILRLIEPTSGSIIIDGNDITQLSRASLRKLRPRYQIIWQNPDISLNPRMKLRDSIMEPLRYFNKNKREDEKKILEYYCSLTELSRTLLGRYPHEVSGGENQRAVIARMLTMQPELLIADEPTSSLDILVQIQLLDLLKTLQQEMNLTLVFISHDLNAVRYMCDDMAVMYKGEILEEGSCEQVLSAPQVSYTQKLVENALKPWSL